MNISIKRLFAGLFLAALLAGPPLQPPALAQESAPEPKVPWPTGLGKRMLEFAQILDPEWLPPRVDSVEEVDKTDYGWYLNEADGFLYIAVYHTGCSCNTERYRVAAFKRSDGGYLLVRSGDQWACDSRIVAEASQPWAEILPPGFSLQSYFREGEKLRPDRAFFLIEVDIPEKGRELTLTARPMMNLVTEYDPEAVFVPLKNRNFSAPWEETINTYSPMARFYFWRAAEDDRLDEEFIGRTEYNRADLDRLAAWALRTENIRNNSYKIEPEPDEVADLTGKLELYYEIYREYLRLGIKSFILEWSRPDNRFKIKDKVRMDPPPSFLDFLITDGFIFATAC